MAFSWNQKLYEEILARFRSPLPRVRFCRITDSRYQALWRSVEEIYYEHPWGPYEGSKDELKKDLAYRQEKLLERRQHVLFHGEAIQQAIDDMAQAGGGRVEIPAGIWYTGALELRSHVELHLEDGARLCFIRNKSNVFYPLRYTRWEVSLMLPEDLMQKQQTLQQQEHLMRVQVRELHSILSST